MREENLRKLWDEVRNLNQQLASVHREISRVERGLPEPFDFGKDWVPPFLRKGSCIPLRMTMLPTKN
jgi:hypothetical protein